MMRIISYAWTNPKQILITLILLGILACLLSHISHKTKSSFAAAGTIISSTSAILILVIFIPLAASMATSKMRESFTIMKNEVRSEYNTEFAAIHDMYTMIPEAQETANITGFSNLNLENPFSITR